MKSDKDYEKFTADVKAILKKQDDYYSKLFPNVKKFLNKFKLDKKFTPDIDLFAASLLRICANIAISSKMDIKTFNKLANEMYLDETFRLCLHFEGQKESKLYIGEEKTDVKATVQPSEFIIYKEENDKAFLEIYNKLDKKESIITKSTDEEYSKFLKSKPVLN